MNSGAAPSGLQDRLQVGWSRFELPNGLRVVVHENRRAPLVAVTLWYRVGAKDEGPGQTGFAHLFEHLMFGGSRHLPGPYLSRLGEMGAQAVNGTTSHDRTNYFQVVPTGSLDAALFAESDRMGHFVDSISAETLAQQKGVVLNEKRQTEGQPYGRVNEHLLRALYPAGHPYAHPVIGSEEDIARATLDDVKAWFRRYYGPSNAVLVLAGDIDEATARQKAAHWFGAIAPGPRLHRHLRWLAPPPQGRRELIEDRVPNARLTLAWPMPPAGDADATRLSIAARVLGGDASARLSQRLVRERGCAAAAGASTSAQLLAGSFVVTLTLHPGQDAAEAEREVHQALQRLADEGPSADELERVKVQCQAGLLGLQGDLAALADTLAMNEVFFGQPDFFVGELDTIRALTAQDLQQALRRWIGPDPCVLHVQPRAEFQASGTDPSRLLPPVIDVARPPPLPTAREATLSNGLRVRLVERHDLPLVQCRLLVPGGTRLEPRAQMGLAELTAALMQRGAGGRGAEAFAHELQRHGATLSAGIALDQAHAGLTSFRSRLEPALDLWADLLLRPAFDAAELDRVRDEAVRGITPSLAAAHNVVGWHLPGLMYGRGHPYARVRGGLRGTLQGITVDDLHRFHRQAFALPEATLLVAGDVTLEALLPLLEARFAGAPAALQPRVVAPVGAARPVAPGVVLIDQPGAQQSTIAAATLLPPFGALDPVLFQCLDQELSGSFSSRLNLNLREARQWTYGVRSELFHTLHQRVHLTVAPVQTDRTAEAMQEIVREMRGLATHPPSAQDLALFRDSTRMRQQARFQSLGAVLGALETAHLFGLDATHWQRQDERLGTLTPAEAAALAEQLFDPRRLVWIVVGDGARIEADIRRLELGRFERRPAEHDDDYLAPPPGATAPLD